VNGAVRGRPQPVRALAAVVLRTLFSDPAALFFMIVLPVMVTVVVGSAFGGQQRLGFGVVESGHSDLGDAIVAALRRDDNLRVETLASQRAVDPAGAPADRRRRGHPGPAGRSRGGFGIGDRVADVAGRVRSAQRRRSRRRRGRR
jgi:hypothetical protein